jgi:uncharacterized oligopeptide transporter (OPT) family protein
MYLPLSSSVPLFIGGLIALISKRALAKHTTAAEQKANYDQIKWQRTLLLACGLVAGATLMDVLLAIPMGLSGNPDVLQLLSNDWTKLTTSLGIVSVIGLGFWFYKIAASEK